MDNYAYQPDENGKPFAITRFSSGPRQSNDYLVEVNSRSKFLKKPKFLKICNAILITLVLILLIIVIILAVLYCTKSYQNKLCTSEECLRSAANLHLSTDFTADPCDNFYDFICGRWSTEHPNHGWFPAFSSFATITERILIATESFLKSDEEDDEPIPVKQARDLYKSCIDSDAIDNLGLSVMDKYLKKTELPVVPSLFTKSDQEIASFKFDWLRHQTVIKKVFVMDMFIGFSVEANMFNRTENVIYIGAPSLTCPLPSPVHKRKNEEQPDYEELRRTANYKVIKYVMNEIIKNSTGSEPKEEILEQATEVLLNMTIQVNDIIGNYSERPDEVYPIKVSDLEKKTNDFLLNNIQKQYPEIWKKYVNHMFEGTNLTVDFEKDYFYTTDADEEYLRKILMYTMTTSDIYLELYTWWAAVFAMIMSTSSNIAEYVSKQSDLFYTGSSVLRTRSLDCVVLINTFMGMATSYALADKAFSNKTKPKVEQMLYDIKDAFVDHVNSLTWMDKETKRATLEKSKEMISFIGYPDWLFQKGALEIYFEGIHIKNDTFLDNMMSIVMLLIPSQLEEFRKLNERNWSTDPMDVNAYNSFPDNSINLPMAILHFPVYNLGLEVLNYGAIGSVLGHELTHGFDNTGRKYDKFGNYKEWWSNATVQTFEEKIECLVKQYDNFTVEGVYNHVQGKKTLGENIADNGGLSHAYKAYRRYLKRHGPEPKLPGFEDYSHDQLFFMAFGNIWCQTISPGDVAIDIETDSHSPNSVRVIGTLQNSQEFARAFRCPIGSKMNPDREKCKVW